MLKSGIEQLREERYRFTIETQGLLYTSKHRSLGTVEEEGAWSEDDSGQDVVSKKKNSPLAKRMVTELTRVLQEGAYDGLTDAAVERLLSGSLQSGSHAPGYDVAKDYIKQVFGQLYGPQGVPSNDHVGPGAGSNPGLPHVSADMHLALNCGYSSRDSTSSSSLVAHAPCTSLPNPTSQPATSFPAAGPVLTAPPWTAAITRGSVVGASFGDELERPRPRPHHGRIKQQLDLLQNADQLAAIISVATTAATTAAAAAVKQSMQTPPPLPPGEYARMHAAGQPMVSGLPLVAAAPGARAPQALQQRLHQHPEHAAATRAAEEGTFGGDSPDPQPLQRHGTLVSPHRRATPLVLTKCQGNAEDGARETRALGQAPGASQSKRAQPGGESAEAHGGDAQLRRQRLRWSQRRGVSLGPSPGGAVDDGGGGAGAANSPSIASGSSNLRVVQLGAPRVTARTPTPVRPRPSGDLFSSSGQQIGQADQQAVNGDGGGGALLFSGEEDAPAGGQRLEPADQRHSRAACGDAAVGNDIQHSAPDGAAAAQAVHGPQTIFEVKPLPIRNSNPVNQELATSGAPVGEDVPADGFFVTGGESVFARARVAMGQTASVRQQAANPVPQPAPPPSRRAALPADVQDAFRSTLAYIANPDGARALAHQAPSLAALADVEERKEAQREAEELLGGAFDYAAMKRELEQARRASRLLQQAAGPVATVAGGSAVVASAGALLHPAAGRSRAGPGAAAVTAVPAKAPQQPRGDFAGLLPPPHSVWDVDEAWFDLDEFSKAVAAEVAYRAAAAAGASPSQRGSPGAKREGRGAAASAAATADPSAQAGRTSVRLPAGRAVSNATADAPVAGTGKEQTNAPARKRAASPRPRSAAPLLAEAATKTATSPSPPRVARKTQVSWPVRVAFGRRVDEPPKAAEGGASRARSGSPPTGRGSPRRARRRARKTSAASGAVASAAMPPASPSSTGDAVHQVLSALASVLLSDEEPDDDLHRAPQSGRSEPDGSVDLQTGLPDPHPPPRRGTREAAAQAEPADALATAPRLEAIRAQHLAAPAATAPSHLPVPLPQPAPPPLPPSASQLQQQQPSFVVPAAERPQSASESSAVHVSDLESGSPHRPATSAAAAAPGAPSLTVASTPTGRSWLAPGAAAWPNSGTVTRSRPRFEYVIDTAHPPVTRLPAWAASAVAADGAPAAYVAALGTAPTGLGFGTPTRRRPAAPAAAAMPFAGPVSQPVSGYNQPLVTPSTQLASTVLGATKTSYAHVSQRQEQPQKQQQPLAFPGLGDLPSTTHVLPPPAAAAALAAAHAATAAPLAGGRAADPGQQWKEAVLQAVEDEVVSRLAAVQLAARGQDPEVSPKDLPGMVPPLVDSELSRRLVCDVLRDNLRSLMASQRHQGAPAAAEAEDAHPTLEEVVAALAAASALPPPRLPPPGQPEAATVAPAALGPSRDLDEQPHVQRLGAAQPSSIGGGDDAGAVGENAASYEESATGAQRVDSAGDRVRLADSDRDAAQPTAGPAAGQPALRVDAALGAAGAAVEMDAGGFAAIRQSGAPQTWQPVYAGRRAQQLLSRASQAAPDVVTAFVQGHDERDAAAMTVSAQPPDQAAAPPAAVRPPGQLLDRQLQSEDVSQHASAAASGANSALSAAALSAPVPWSLTQATQPKPALSKIGGAPASTLSSSPTELTLAPLAPAVFPMAAATAGPGVGWTGPQLVGKPGFLDFAAITPSASTRSQGTQAQGVQARGVQVHGAEARGVQAHGVVEARGVQAHGAEARGTQAGGVQERATQAAGVMDSSSQADPPAPHFLLQAALAAGLSYGAGPGLPYAAGSAGAASGQVPVGPDGTALSMPRPFYLVPADNSQVPASLGLYGAAPGFAFAPCSRGEGSRPPLNLPGLSKLRDSSDVDSSSDSLGQHAKGPGARARAAALEALRLASRSSFDSDDGLLQRSYVRLELASLTARPVRLEPHRSSSDQSQRSQTSAAAQEQSRGGSWPQSLAPTDRIGGAAASGSTEGGSLASGVGTGDAPMDMPDAPRYLTESLGPPSRTSADDAPRDALRGIADGAAASTAPPRYAGAAASLMSGASEGVSSGVNSGSAALTSANVVDGEAPAGPSGGSSIRSSEAPSAAGAGTSATAMIQVTELPSTPAVADDELVGDSDDVAGDDEEEEPDRIHSVHFDDFPQDESTAVATELVFGSAPATAAPADVTDTVGLASLSSSPPASASSTVHDAAAPTGNGRASRPASEHLSGSARSGEREREGGRYGSGGEGSEAKVVEFALSDDELLDDAEVARVLAEEGHPEFIDEDDEELRAMEGQAVMLQDSSFEDEVDLTASPSPRSSAPGGGDEAATAEVDGGGSAAAQSGVEGEALAVVDSETVAPPLRGGEHSGNTAGNRQTASAEQSRAPSLTASSAPGARSGAAGWQPPGGDAADGESPGAATSVGGSRSSGSGKTSGSSSSTSRQPSALASSRGSGASGPRSSAVNDDASEPSSSSLRSAHVDIENQPIACAGGWGSTGGSAGAGGAGSEGDAALRTSLEGLALAGLATLGRLQSWTSVGGTGLMRATAAPAQLTSQMLPQPQQPLGRAGVAALTRPALVPLQPVSLQPGPIASDGGAAAQPPDSPSKPPSLASYHGPTRPLWRPPSAQSPPDPMMSSSETLMASSEASGPTLDPLPRVLLEGQRRTLAVRRGDGLASAAQRAESLGLAGSQESSVSTSMDSVRTFSAIQPPSVAGITLPRQLARMPGAAAASGPTAALARGVLGSLEASRVNESVTESDDDRPDDGSLQQARYSRQAAATAAGRANAVAEARASSRYEGAVFRLRQYGARRRKLLQQIGVKDSLLLSSATSLSTDSSTVSDSEDGPGGATMLRGRTAATRRM